MGVKDAQQPGMLLALGHLPPWLSCELIARAGLVLRDIPEHRAYRYILDCLFMDRMEDVQRFLKENKLEPLKQNASA